MTKKYIEYGKSGFYSAVRKCSVCGAGSFAPVEESGGGFRVLRCLDCGFCFVNPVPPPDLLRRAYCDEYYSEWLGPQRKKRIKMWNKRLRTVNGLKPQKGSLLDIGCGEGLFIELAKKDGWAVSGTEFSPYAAKYANDRAGGVFCGDIRAAGFPDGEFDVVTIWHVLEHTPDPGAVVCEIRRIIKNDGLLFVAVPNLDSSVYRFLYRLFKFRSEPLFSMEKRELHLQFFNPATLSMLLEKNGFEVLSIIRDRGIVQLKYRLADNLAQIVSIIEGRLMTQALQAVARPKKLL